MKVMWLGVAAAAQAMATSYVPTVQAIANSSGVAVPSQAPQQCPDPSALRNICNFVASQERVEVGGGRSRLRFQMAMDTASCASRDQDGEAEYNRAIRELWNSHLSQTGCTIVGFNIEGGNVAKLAIRKRDFEFLNILMEAGADFNAVDPADGWTLLDYTKREFLANQVAQDTGIARELREYYELLREAGARHCRELPDTSRCQARDRTYTDPWSRDALEPGLPPHR